MVNKEAIKEFWENRAKEYGKSMCATLGETYLRKLEIKTMVNIIKKNKPDSVLEIGCGNGYSTSIYAERFPKMKMFATDYSKKMIDLAKSYYQKNNVIYDVWDVTQPSEYPFKIDKYDLIFSQRVIQNLPTWEMQKNTIRHLISMLKDNGKLCIMECSEEGVDQLNNARKKIRRPRIDGIIPWHNKFISDKKMMEEFADNINEITHFSATYMFITRLISMRLAKYAWLLPPIGKFGYDKVFVLSVKSTAKQAKISGKYDCY